MNSNIDLSELHSKLCPIPMKRIAQTAGAFFYVVSKSQGNPIQKYKFPFSALELLAKYGDAVDDEKSISDEDYSQIEDLRTAFNNPPGDSKEALQALKQGKSWGGENNFGDGPTGLGLTLEEAKKAMYKYNEEYTGGL